MHRAGQPPLLLPRGLIFLASIWLIGSWIIAIGVRQPVQPSSATYTPAVRLMLICIATGLMIGWPLLRLSQERPPYPLRQTLLDLVVLVGLVQVVVWPLRLVTSWTILRTAAIDATLVGWTLLAGAVVAGTVGTQHARLRYLAMIGCTALCLLGPALAWIGLLFGLDLMQLADVSALIAVKALIEAGGPHPSPMQWRAIALLGLADVLAWVIVCVVAFLQQRRVARPNAAPETSLP